MSWFLALILLSGLSVKAETYGVWQYSVSNGEATITGYTGGGGAVEIPDLVAGIPVKTLGFNPIFSSIPVTSVTIPNSVTSIRASAFAGCSAISIFMPESVTFIGVNAFANCSALKSLIIPKNVTELGFAAFMGCPNLTSIYFLGNLPFVDNMMGGSGPKYTFMGTPSTVYILPDGTGWGLTFEDRPVVRLSVIETFNLGQQSILTNPNQNHLYTESLS